MNNIWTLQTINERCGDKIAALTSSALSKAQIFWKFDTSQIGSRPGNEKKEAKRTEETL